MTTGAIKQARACNRVRDRGTPSRVPGSVSDRRVPSPALALVRELCRALEAAGVHYCHWKSNAALARSASGENDLDLLIARTDSGRFVEVMHRLGFREARGTERPQVPGILDYLGYDRASGRLVHVHAHYRLIVGHDACKNYHLAVEEAYLQSSVQGDLFRVPAPEFELAILVIRLVLKHATWDAIACRQGSLAPGERQELAYLEAQTTPAHVHDVLSQHLPFIDAALFDDCRQALQVGSSATARIGAGRRLLRALAGYGRRGRASEVRLRLQKRLLRALRRRRGRRGLRPAAGGLMVAVVGGDGAGKSTAIAGLRAWLKRFDLLDVHLGKPPRSRLTRLVRALLKLGRLAGLWAPGKESLRPEMPPVPSEFLGYPWLLERVCVARDRYLAYARARRFAANGGLVLCDRFPLPQVMPMDGPRLGGMMAEPTARPLTRRLADLEAHYYRSIVPPDVLVVLRVDPERAVGRKAEESRQFVRARCQEVWDIDWGGRAVHVFDANQPRDVVLSQLRDLIWQHL